MQNTITNGSRIPLIRIIITFSTVIMLLNCAIIIKRGITSYHDSVLTGQANAGRLIHTVSDHIELTFFAVDLALKRAAERQYFNTLFGNNLQEDIQNNFIGWVNETPQISAMLMTNEYGDVFAIYRKQGYKTWMEGKENLAKEPYFQAHLQAEDFDELYVGCHPSWFKNHSGFVVMSRRIHKLDGSFGGIVLVAVNSDYVLNFFKSITATNDTKLILIRDHNDWDNNTTLINQLGEPSDLTTLQRIMTSQNIANSTANITTVIHEDEKNHPYDDDIKLFSFDHIANLHMIVSLVTYGEDIFAEWTATRLNDLIFLAMFALFVLVISIFAIAVAKQIQRVQRSERAAVMASQAKSDFLANMSHELRTPLNAIIGFSEMMEAGYFGNLNSKQKERIHDINYCGTHLLELINDILEFSKGEAGKIELREEKVSVPKLIKDTLRIFAERTKKDNITIIYEPEDELPLIMADGRKIKQILLNLLSNAVKFTESGGTIEITCRPDEDNNMIITVTDTGIGMAEEDIPKALSAFGQVHKDIAGTKASSGTGLGLPLCKMFAELHGGELQMQSILGVGTKVSVIIPSDRMITSATGLPPAGIPKASSNPTQQKDVTKPDELQKNKGKTKTKQKA